MPDKRSAAEVVKLLSKIEGVTITKSRGKGSHIMAHIENPRKAVTIPTSRGKEPLSKGVLNQIVRELNLPKDTFKK